MELEEHPWDNDHEPNSPLSNPSASASPNDPDIDPPPPSTTVPRVFDNEEDALAYSLTLADRHKSETAGGEVESEYATTELAETPAYELGNLGDILRMLEAQVEDWIPFTPDVVLVEEDEDE